MTRSWLTCVVVCLFVSVFQSAEAQQSKERTGKDIEVLKPTQLSAQFASPQEERVIDAPLDPNTYRLGMGDLIEVSIDGNPPIVTQTTVSGEGAVVLPFVGETVVGGMSLKDAREKLKYEVKRSYKLSRVSVGLVRSRLVRIRVEGTAVHPGYYEFPASARVSTILARPRVRRSLRPIAKDEIVREEDLVPYASRSILLRRLDGTVQRVDLLRFMTHKESAANPHLSEGAEVIIDAFNENIPSVALGGALWLPGRYEYKEGDRLSDLMKYGRGFRPGARTDSIVRYRTGLPPHAFDISTADSEEFIAGGDRVWVPYSGSISRAEIVTVSGELNHPGLFPVEAGVTRLSDVLSMAGGFTENALVPASVVLRTFGKGPTAGLDILGSFRGSSALEDSQYVRQELEIRLLGERVEADFGRAMTLPGGDGDPFLYGGDHIYVPRSTRTVYVFGQVSSPGHYPFISGTSFAEYVHDAGGFTSRAKEDEAVVIKRGTRQWIDPSATTIEEGDAIWVPRQVEMGLFYELQSYAQIGSVVSSIATIVLIIVQLLK